PPLFPMGGAPATRGSPRFRVPHLPRPIFLHGGLPTCLHGGLPTCLHGGRPTRLHGSRPTRLPTSLLTDPPLSSPHRSPATTEVLEIGEFSPISARERSLAEAAHPCVRTHLGRP